MWRVRAGGKFPEAVLEQWIYANSTHTIDLLRFFGGEATQVQTITHRHTENKGDQFAAIMELECGAIGQYMAHWYSPGGWRVVLYGDGVTVEFKPLERGRWIDKNSVVHDIQPDEIDAKYKAGFYRQIEAFRRLVREGSYEWPVADLADSLKTMELAQKFTKHVTLVRENSPRN